MLRKLFFVVPVTVLAIGGSSACATKKFVSTAIAKVEPKLAQNTIAPTAVR